MSVVVVTGGSGWIGRAVVNRLIERGHEPLPFDRTAGLDVTDPVAVDDYVRDADHVIHLAGLLGTHELFDQARPAVEVNVLGSFNVVEACARHNVGLVNITMPDVNPSLYAATKNAALRLIEVYRQAHGLRASHVKAYNAYGPGQAYGSGHPQKIVPTFAVAGWRGEPLPVWGSGLLWVDLVHVDDVARMLVDALAFGNGEVFDAGCGQPWTVREVAERVIELTGGHSEIKWLPARPGERLIPTSADFANHVDTAAKLGWVPTWDSARFKETVDSYRTAT